MNSPISFYSYTFKQILNHATKNKKVTKTNTINKPRGFEGNYITSANPSLPADVLWGSFVTHSCTLKKSRYIYSIFDIETQSQRGNSNSFFMDT